MVPNEVSHIHFHASITINDRIPQMAMFLNAFVEIYKVWGRHCQLLCCIRNQKGSERTVSRMYKKQNGRTLWVRPFEWGHLCGTLVQKHSFLECLAKHPWSAFKEGRTNCDTICSELESSRKDSPVGNATTTDVPYTRNQWL